jgi:hypothetical protein
MNHVQNRYKGIQEVRGVASNLAPLLHSPGGAGETKAPASGAVESPYWHLGRHLPGLSARIIGVSLGSPQTI